MGILLLSVGLGLWFFTLSQDPHAIDLTNRLARPSLTHLLGTDHLGRDLASRLICGAAPSLIAIIIVLTGGLAIGVLAGGLIALGPPVVSDAAKWLSETTLAVPTLVTALVFSAVFGVGPLTVALALLATSWAPYAITVAALFDRIAGEPYWRASQALGTPIVPAISRHMLPNAQTALGALAGADAGRAVIVVASLGFIGLSADTGRPEWGAMIHEYRMFLFIEPRLVLSPILACTFVCVLLHAAIDPSERLGLRLKRSASRKRASAERPFRDCL